MEVPLLLEISTAWHYLSQLPTVYGRCQPMTFPLRYRPQGGNARSLRQPASPWNHTLI